MVSIEQKRDEFIESIPRWYSGSVHFTLIHIFTLGTIAACLAALREPMWKQWLLVPCFFIFANAFEWWIHRGPMHHRTPALSLLYQRHTLEHHVVFTDKVMGLRNDRELYYVLFPPWFLPLILAMNLPLALLLSFAGSPNLGFLFYASALAYYLVYEWFHCVHHIPPETWIGRRAIVGRLRRHHTDHHDPARMEKGNFNVSFPLWDWLLGSTLTEPTDKEV